MQSAAQSCDRGHDGNDLFPSEPFAEPVFLKARAALWRKPGHQAAHALPDRPTKYLTQRCPRRAFHCKALRAGEADPCRAAGNDGHFACEPPRHDLPPD